MRKTLQVLLVVLLGLLLVSPMTADAAKKPKFEGYKKCGGCHKSQKTSWLETAHAKAYESLKAGKNEEAKTKAKLDPKKDYSKDKKCIGCHVTGFAKTGGFRTKLPKAKAKYLKGVGCESCHGPGSLYRKSHRKASNKFKKKQKKTARKTLLKVGQILDYENEACAKCHLNYEGSGWDGIKEPYTPFTPKVDAKYKFDYDKGVRETGKDKAMHEHYKLRNVYEGEPIPSEREEFQKNAKEPAAPEEEEGDK